MLEDYMPVVEQVLGSFFVAITALLAIAVLSLLLYVGVMACFYRAAELTARRHRVFATRLHAIVAQHNAALPKLDEQQEGGVA